MANSKINTEETILRTPTDTPANADANSVRVYTDGTHVFSKDSAGNEVNLSTGGGGGGGSSASPARSIQLSDGSGGFSTSGWEVTNTDEDLNPSTHVNKQLGDVGKAIEKAYFGSGGINLLKDNTITSSSVPAVADTDYSKIYTDNSAGSLYFKSVGVSSVHHYYMQDNDSSVELHLAGNSKYFTLKTPADTQHNQTLTLPKTIGNDGQFLALSNKTGTGINYEADLIWQHAKHYFNPPFPNLSSPTFGSTLSWGSAIDSTTDSPDADSTMILDNGNTWDHTVTGDNSGVNYSHTTRPGQEQWGPLSVNKAAVQTFEGDLIINFYANASNLSTAWPTSGVTVKVKVSVAELVMDQATGVATAGSSYEHTFNSVSLSTTTVGSATYWYGSISKSDLNSNLYPTGGIIHKDAAIIVTQVRIFEPSASVVASASGFFRMGALILPQSIQITE